MLHAHRRLARSGEVSGVPCNDSHERFVEQDVPRRVATLLLHSASEGRGSARATSADCTDGHVWLDDTFLLAEL
jgi:hypothetical protein